MKQLFGWSQLDDEPDLLSQIQEEPSKHSYSSIYKQPLRLSADLIEKDHAMNKSDFAEYLAWCDSKAVE